MKNIIPIILILFSLQGFSQNAFKGANTHKYPITYESNLGSSFTARQAPDKGYVDSSRNKARDSVATIANAGSKGWLIESPTASENLPVWQTPVAITVSSVQAVLRGTSPSVTYQISFGTDINTLTNVYTAGQTVTSTTTGTAAATFNDATIPANSWIVITTSAVSGTITSLTLTLNYTKD